MNRVSKMFLFARELKNRRNYGVPVLYQFIVFEVSVARARYSVVCACSVIRQNLVFFTASSSYQSLWAGKFSKKKNFGQADAELDETTIWF